MSHINHRAPFRGIGFRSSATGKVSRAGFSLIELMIAAGLGSVILAGVLSVFLAIGRIGYNAAGYSTMDAESRRGLEVFAADARMASNLTAISATSVTLLVNGAEVTYAYDSSMTGPTKQSFYTKAGPAASGATPRILVRDVSDFSFSFYKLVNGVEYNAANIQETKQIQISLRAVRSRTTVVDATNAVLSARVVLRNKKVST